MRIPVFTSVHEKYFLAEQKQVLSFPHNLVLNLQRPHLFPRTEDSFEAICVHYQVICGWKNYKVLDFKNTSVFINDFFSFQISIGSQWPTQSRGVTFFRGGSPPLWSRPHMWAAPRPLATGPPPRVWGLFGAGTIILSIPRILDGRSWGAFFFF